MSCTNTSESAPIGTNEVTADVLAGSAIYNNFLLAIYDFWVLGISNTFAWKCPTSLILEHFQKNLSSRHLDIGVGTGFYLKKSLQALSQKNSPFLIVLGDLNPNSLSWTERKIAKFKPQSLYLNVFDPRTYPKSKFDSISVNYLFHCLPGPFSKKLDTLLQLAPLLNSGGVLFGSTILGSGVKHNLFGQFLQQLYNQRKIFTNLDDNEEELRNFLGLHFKHFELKTIGTVAVFKIVIGEISP